MALTGTDYLAQIAADTTWAQRSARAATAIRNGDTPDWFRLQDWPTVVSKETIDGVVRTLTMRVAPDFVAVGTSADYARAPMTPSDAQSIANAFHWVLPTRKMVRLAWQQAKTRVKLSDVKEAPTLIPQLQIELPKAVVAARTIDRLHIANNAPAEGIVDGERKTVVVGPRLDGSRVAIFGGQAGDSKGKGTGATPSHPEDAAFVQPYSMIHIASYLDYSHGIRFVARMADLDGTPVDLDTIALNPKLAVLVSDQRSDAQGPTLFPLRFPSTGTSGGGGDGVSIPISPDTPVPPVPPIKSGSGGSVGPIPVGTIPPKGAPPPRSTVPGASTTTGLAVGAIVAIGLGAILLGGRAGA